MAHDVKGWRGKVDFCLLSVLTLWKCGPLWLQMRAQGLDCPEKIKDFSLIFFILEVDSPLPVFRGRRHRCLGRDCYGRDE